MSSDRLCQSLCVYRQTTQVISPLFACLLFDLSLGLTHPQTLQSRPIKFLRKMFRRVDMPIVATLYSPMLAINCLVCADLIAVGVIINHCFKKRDHVFM